QPVRSAAAPGQFAAGRRQQQQGEGAKGQPVSEDVGDARVGGGDRVVAVPAHGAVSADVDPSLPGGRLTARDGRWTPVVGSLAYEVARFLAACWLGGWRRWLS